MHTVYLYAKIPNWQQNRTRNLFQCKSAYKRNIFFLDIYLFYCAVQSIDNSYTRIHIILLYNIILYLPITHGNRAVQGTYRVVKIQCIHHRVHC